MFIGPSDGLPCFINSFGASITINNRTYRPLISEEGQVVESNKQTNIVVNRLFINKLPSPYSNCIAYTTNPKAFDSYFYNFTFHFYGKYIQKYCIFNCASQKSNLRVIHCLYQTNLTIEQFNNCSNSLIDFDPFYPDCYKDCPAECESQSLTFSEHIANYPTKAYGTSLLDDIATRLKNADSSFNPENLTFDLVKTTILSVNVYYESNMYTQIDDAPSSDLGNLLANIGGQLGKLAFLFINFFQICISY